MSPNVQFIFGGGTFMDQSRYSLEEIPKVLDILQENGVTTIDTARIYGESEDLLGQVKASSRFTIDTKLPGGFNVDPTTPETVLATAEQSLKLLQTDQVDVYYIHAPDRRASLPSLLASINALHQSGKFKRFGLSNFLASEVEEVISIAKENNYVLPTVYQGNYNAIARHAEEQILPTLRKHNITYYAYSPIAGGFLTKSVDQLVAGGEGRWDPNSFLGELYHSLYNKPSMMQGLRLWEEIAEEAGIPKVELAYRWVAYHSALSGERGDGLVFGASSFKQLRQTLGSLRAGPLSEEIAGRVEEVWKIVEGDAPLDNFNNYLAAKEGEDVSLGEKQ